MTKRKAAPGKSLSTPPDLFAGLGKRRQRALILPRFLAQEANHAARSDEAKERGAHDILKHWAHLEKEGHLDKKETALDAGYLEKVFGDALGYKTLIESPTK